VKLRDIESQELFKDREQDHGTIVMSEELSNKGTPAKASTPVNEGCMGPN